jgi:hypothetical protein
MATRGRGRAGGAAGAPGLALAALLLAGMLLSACATGGADLAQTGSTPARATPGVFPAVHDMPRARPNTTLSDAEQHQIQQELLTARDSQVVKAQQGVQPIEIEPPPPIAARSTAQAAGSGRNP